MKKSKFDPSAAFKSIIGINEQEPQLEQEQPPQQPQREQVQNAALKGRPKADRETKKRVSLAILPSLYDNVQKIAYVERKSISEIVSECLEQYAAEHTDKLNEYDKIRK